MTLGRHSIKIKNRRKEMNRPLAIVLSFLLLWSGVAYGLSGMCCCTRDACSLSEQATDNCESGHHHSSNLGSAIHHDSNDRSFLTICTCRYSAFDPSDLESVTPGHQAVALPVALISSEGFFQTGPPISSQIYAFPANPLNILLKTCSFLS